MAKKGKDAGGGAAEGEGIRLSRHPRAQRHIAMAKGWGGFGTFLVAVWLSHRAGLPTTDALLRGIGAGVVGYLAAWMIAVTVWRQLALAELERLRSKLVADMERQAAEVEARTQQARGGPSGGGAPVAG